MTDPRLDPLPGPDSGFLTSAGVEASPGTSSSVPPDALPNALPCPCAASYPGNVCPFHNPTHPDYGDIQEESALAMAQATISQAIIRSGVSRTEIARRLGLHHSSVSKALKGEHNLTIKNMARLLRVCGFGVRFELYKLDMVEGRGDDKC